VRTKIVVGNWKMNLTQAETKSLLSSLLPLISDVNNVQVGVCPGFVSLTTVADQLSGTNVGLGAQNVFWKESGAFTGFVSPAMLKDAGVTYVLVGHSETRGRFGKLEVPATTVGFFAETDETVNLKIKALLPHGFTPILCVGENLAEREVGNTDSVIQAQLDGALVDLSADEIAKLVVAYEPVWAIGTGQTCDTPEAERVCGMIRAHLRTKVGDVAERIQIQYGGSVKASNAADLFGQPNIDGGLVGGASLMAEEFAAIVKAAG
jgi:triosephosphate isomerase